MRKVFMVPSMFAAVVFTAALLLAGCQPVTAPETAAPATEVPAAPEAAPDAETCTPGAGSIAVLLPDSAAPRWENDDRRFFEETLAAYDVPFTIANAYGNAAAQLEQARQALAEGAQVLVLTSVDSETGAAIIDEARSAGARVIDYDRLTVVGPGADLYVSFDNFAVGSMMAQSLEPLINNLDVEMPRVVQLNGGATDNNASLVRAGYSFVATPYYNDGRWLLVADREVPNWDVTKAGELFELILAGAGDEGVDVVFAANDVLAGAVVRVLQAQDRDPVLLSGQDATVEGLQNILAGWQTMTVYKPIQNEVLAAADSAVAMINCKDPSTMVTNAVINNGERDIPFIMLDPIAVTVDNISTTVIADGFRSWEEICSGEYEQFCPPAEQR